MSKNTEQSVDIGNDAPILKTFDDWNLLKKKISIQEKECFPKCGEVWFVNFGQNLGYEMNGKTHEFWRPILVLKKLSYNIFLVIPLTTQERRGAFSKKISKNSFVLFDQIRVLDKRRFIYKIDKISSEEFQETKTQCKKYLF